MAYELDITDEITICEDNAVVIKRGRCWTEIDNLFPEQRSTFALIGNGGIVRTQEMTEAQAEEANQKFKWALSPLLWVVVEEWELQ
jgi:hypothetical protein